MSLDLEYTRYIIDIAQLFLMFFFVSIAFYKFMTKKYEGKRDKARFLLFLTFVMFQVVNLDKIYRYSQGIPQSPEFGFVMRNWAQVFMFMMVFEVLNIKYLYYSIPILVIYVQIFYPIFLDPLSTGIGVVSMFLMFYIGWKYKAEKLIGLALMGVLGFLIVFGAIMGNAIVLIIVYTINDIYKIFFITDNLHFFKKEKQIVSEDPLLEGENE